LEIQTASGDAKAEMILEGLPDPLAVRDFLYDLSRGARNAPQGPEVAPDGSAQTLTQALQDVAAELRLIREALDTNDRQPPEAAE
jgi:putative membrane protein